MDVASLKPIDSNLKRIRLVVRKQRQQNQSTDSPTKSKWPSALKLRFGLQELHFALLGTMVAVQGMQGDTDIKMILHGLRSQILVFRDMKDILDNDESEGICVLRDFAKAIMISFYDLEGILRKLAAGKSPKKSTTTSLVAAIAEKSKSAVELAMTKSK